MNRRTKKLSLHKETLRMLDPANLGRVGGGAAREKDGGGESTSVWDPGCPLETTMKGSRLECFTKNGGPLCGPFTKK